MTTAEMPSIDEALKGPNVKTVAGFPPNADFQIKGERFMGVYTGSVDVTLPNKKPFKGHLFELISSEGPWLSGKKSVTPSRGETVSCSGAVLDRILTAALIGKTVIITYEGKGEAKGGNNAPKLYTVNILG